MAINGYNSFWRHNYGYNFGYNDGYNYGYNYGILTSISYGNPQLCASSSSFIQVREQTQREFSAGCASCGKANAINYLVAHPTNRKWVITPVIYMG